jgi:predicted transcriptional regulator
MNNHHSSTLKVMSASQQVAYLVRQYRQTFSMSQAKLARKVGMDQATIARIEAGTANPSLATLDRLAVAMHSQIDIRFRLNR